MPRNKSNGLPKGIRMRGEAFFVDASYQGKRKTATCHSLEEAVAKRLKLMDELMGKGEFANAGSGQPWTMRQAYDQTCRETWNRKKAGKYLKGNAMQVLDYVGQDTPVTEVTRKTIFDMASHFTDQGNSVATVNRKLAALSKMLQVAVENHELSGLTVKPTIKKEKEVNVRLRYLNDRECIQVVELAEYFGGRDHADAVACLLDTGLRIDSELFQLQARDIDFDMGEGTVKVYGSDEKGTKGGDWRAVPMTSRVRAILKRRVEGLKPTDRVFPYPYHWMRGVWQKIREDMRMLGDKDFTPHVLRHTFCSRLAQADVSLQNIQQLAGHSDTRITLRYAKLNSRNLINSIKAIDTPTLRVVDQASGSG